MKKKYNFVRVGGVTIHFTPPYEGLLEVEYMETYQGQEVKINEIEIV